jgi:hypothetical protein
VEDRISAAVENNAKWCDLVCRSHRISTSWTEGFWVSRQPSPQFYPEGVTLQPKVSPEQLINELPPGPCSVKDSFADLDLASRGFEQLFDARWIYRVPPVGAQRATGWTAISAEEEFGQWLLACGLLDVLPEALLRDQSVRVLQRKRANDVTAGAVLNRTGSVVGLSNVFSLNVPLDEVWGDLVVLAAQEFPSCPIVGYERGEDLDVAIGTGFNDLGGLRVWLQVR